MTTILSEPHNGTNLPAIKASYVLLGAIFLVVLGLFILRKRAPLPPTLPVAMPSPILEKDPSRVFETRSASGANVRIPAQPPPFTPPPAPLPSPETQPVTFDAFDSFEPVMELPRRRSYTKTTSGGQEVLVEGEILDYPGPESWRRHTRVFGGGVCKACEESDRRMSA